MMSDIHSHLFQLNIFPSISTLLTLANRTESHQSL